ncbi:MAG: beta-ketoacyl-ACP reductase [Acidiferrobacterales bacterium]
MAKRLEGKVALVTGGTGGIGTAICKRLADAGCRVVTNYRNEEKTLKWRQSLGAQGYEVATFKGDVSDYEQCEAVIAQTEKEVGPIDILVNNAGITRDATFRKMTHDQWDAVISSNLDSVFNVTRPVIQGMMDRGFGRVVNISSINGQKGQFGQANYSAAKAGMHGFSMALAQEVARKGITVNTVSPGYIATEMVMAVPEEVRAKIIAGIPAGRLGEPEEVAYVVEFLASDEAGFITGADISINGGQYMS